MRSHVGGSVCKWKHIELLVLTELQRKGSSRRAWEDWRGYKVHVGCVRVSAKAKLCLLVRVWERKRYTALIHEKQYTKMKTSARKQRIARPTQNFIRQYHSFHICHLSFIKPLHPLYKLFMPLAKCIHTILFTLLLHFYSALFPTFVYKNKSLL